MISLASSLTSTAPSSLLSLATISYIPYLSTSTARLGWTSQTVLTILKRLSRTRALLCPSRSTTRLKNCALAIPMAMFVDIRQIFKKGSNSPSNELALAEMKHFSNASSVSGFKSWSSTLAVSSCSLRSMNESYITKRDRENRPRMDCFQCTGLEVRVTQELYIHP